MLHRKFASPLSPSYSRTGPSCPCHLSVLFLVTLSGNGGGKLTRAPLSSLVCRIATSCACFRMASLPIAPQMTISSSLPVSSSTMMALSPSRTKCRHSFGSTSSRYLREIRSSFRLRFLKYFLYNSVVSGLSETQTPLGGIVFLARRFIVILRMSLRKSSVSFGTQLRQSCSRHLGSFAWMLVLGNGLGGPLTMRALLSPAVSSAVTDLLGCWMADMVCCMKSYQGK